MGITEYIITFIQDKNIKSTRKFVYAIFGLIFLFSIDYFFKFSDSYIADKKIDQLEQIYKLRKSHKLSQEATNELLNIEKSIINRQGFWSLSTDFISLIQRTINSTKHQINPPIKTNPIIKENLKVKKERSIVWHIISTNWAWLLIMIVLPFAMTQPGQYIENKIAIIIFVEVLLIILIGIFSYITALIPTFREPIWNYVFNGLIQFFFVLTFAAIGKRNK